MSRDVITFGWTMQIPLLYRGEYSQWRERFMNYLGEQTDGEAMINSIKNGDHPLPIVAQMSLAGTAPNAIPTLKDPKTQMIFFEFHLRKTLNKIVFHKHMTGNRALLTNFVKKFLGTVRFGNNDFAVIAGYGDVVTDQ
nr:integrase, catalytic region, zinc finger, CCHC-type, peptidase aspartic, catalytic [Tanacetum cinerariifolium]